MEEGFTRGFQSREFHSSETALCFIPGAHEPPKAAKERATREYP